MDSETSSRSDTSDFKLGDWWVRPQHNELERAGEKARVEARSMEVLVCLARYAPGVVRKERLLEEVWSDSPYVGEGVISHAIWELRKVLGDSARDSAYIQTVPRKGYRLTAEVLRPQGSPLPAEGVRIDHYDIQEEIGRGSMGVVYKARDRRLDRTVAVKFLAAELTRDPKACRRFEREARLAASLEHPNLATVHEIGETSGRHRYLVNAYYAGGSLKDRLAAGPLEVDEAVRLVRQMVAGLGAAHERGIIHRDVKPANLLLDEHGTLKVCDFGIAKLLGATELTRTGVALGTPAYKSPEQARGTAVDHRTDLWSAGVVFFELLTGRRPFDGEFEQAVLHSILSGEPRPTEDAGGRPLPEAVTRVVAKAMAKDPEDRYQSAGEMLAALEGLPEDASASPAARPSRTSVAVSAGVLVALAALGLLSYQQREPPPEERTAGAGPSGSGAGGAESAEGIDHLALGRSQWLRGNHPANLREVRQHFEEAVELLPRSVEARGHLAAFLAESYALSKEEDDRSRALELIHEAQALDPRGPSLALAAKSWLLLMDGDVDEAARLAGEAIDLEPTCDRSGVCDLAYLWRAEALWVQGREEEALAALEEGTRWGGGYIRCRLRRALFLDRSGRKREAEGDYLHVLELDDVQTTALHELANLYLNAKRFREAQRLLDRLHKTTQDPRVLISIGYVLYERELWDEAIAIYRKAHADFQKEGSAVPTPLVAIGDIHLARGQKREAQVLFREALEVFDAIAEPGIDRQAQRAVCLAKLDLFDEAVEEIQRLLAYVDDTPDILFYAGRIYALQGDRETLFELAGRWVEKGGEPSRFLDDPAFIPYRKDREYLRILEPELIPDRVEISSG